jgi:hypothetical protein
LAATLTKSKVALNFIFYFELYGTERTERHGPNNLLKSGGAGRMAKFYLHRRAGGELILDEEGAEFADYTAALHEVTLAAREILADAIRSGRPYVAESFVIANGLGQELGSLPLATLLPKPFGHE